MLLQFYIMRSFVGASRARFYVVNATLTELRLGNQWMR